MAALPFILTIDTLSFSVQSAVRQRRNEASEGRAAAHECERSKGDWGTSPTSSFARKDRQGFLKQKQGVYHLALLATFVLHRHTIHSAFSWPSQSE